MFGFGAGKSYRGKACQAGGPVKADERFPEGPGGVKGHLQHFEVPGVDILEVKSDINFISGKLYSAVIIAGPGKIFPSPSLAKMKYWRWMIRNVEGEQIY